MTEDGIQDADTGRWKDTLDDVRAVSRDVRM
jgi:hypothetical protein